MNQKSKKESNKFYMRFMDTASDTWDSIVFHRYVNGMCFKRAFNQLMKTEKEISKIEL